MVHLKVHHVPIDENLMGALPPSKRSWLTKLGVKGMLDVEGDLSQAFPKPQPVSQPSLAATQTADSSDSGDLPFVMDPLDFKLKVQLVDGQITPEGSKFSLSNASATMELTPDALHLEIGSARRGDQGTVIASGDVAWPNDQPNIALHAQALALPLDQELHDLLPAEAQAGWDALRPLGTVDAEVSYHSDAANNAAGSPQTQPAALPNVRLVLQPRVLSIKPVGLPFRFDALKGALSIEGEHLIVSGLTARHGDAEFTLSGTGDFGVRPTYDLQMSAKDLLIGPELRDALPASVQSIIDGLKLHGPCNFRFAKLVYRAAAPAPTTAPSETAPAVVDAAAPALDFSLVVTLRGGGLDVGVPLDDVNGTVKIEAQLRDGALAGIRGNIDVDSLTMAGRVLHNFTADLVRSDDGNGLKLMRMEADLAGGEMAGEVDILFPNDGPSRYTLDLVVRNADVRELAGETDRSVQGDLTASLSLEGAWGDPASRRGRGDVLVTGKDMYRIPLLLGLLQVTNLALPIAEPFHRGSARYSLDGQRVNFDQIELRSDTMLMTGTGHLDFGTKQVRMSFVTDNPSGIQVPILNDLLKGARNELLKINVKGTITQPKVETSVMGTFTTTVDEVLRGDSVK